MLVLVLTVSPALILNFMLMFVFSLIGMLISYATCLLIMLMRVLHECAYIIITTCPSSH